MTFEEWLEENGGLLNYMAQYYHDSGYIPIYISKRDLFQEAVIKAQKAWDNYDEKKGDFLPYVIAYVGNKMREIDRSITDHGRRCGTTVISENAEPSQDPIKRRKELEWLLYKGIKEQLSNKLYETLTACYGLFGKDKQTYEEYGEANGLTKQGVGERMNRAKDKLQEWLVDHGYEAEDIVKLSMKG